MCTIEDDVLGISDDRSVEELDLQLVCRGSRVEASLNGLEMWGMSLIPFALCLQCTLGQVLILIGCLTEGGRNPRLHRDFLQRL